MDILAGSTTLKSRTVFNVARVVPVSAVSGVGFIACQFHATYALASIVVIAWALAESRKQAFFYICLYTVFSTWVVVPAIVDYLGWHPLKALAFWIAVFPVMMLPWYVLYRADEKCLELRLLLILLMTWLPPMGAVQFASPFIGTSLLIPGLQWGSLLAGIMIVGGVVRCIRHRQRSLTLLLTGIAAVLNVSGDAQKIPGWVAVDTAVNVGGFFHTIEGSAEALDKARSVALDTKARVVVLGESTGGYSVDAGRRVLGRALDQSIVLAGGRVDEKQALFEWNQADSKRVYHQRLRPVLLEPVNGDLDGKRIIEIDGLTVAPLICYEGAVPYPFTTALYYQPDAIVSIANFSWSRNDAYFERVLRAHVSAWGRIWNIPTLVAVNSRSQSNV